MYHHLKKESFMHYKNMFTSSLLAGTMLCATAFATDYTIDSSHSQVSFKIKHMGISTVSGYFEKFDGTFSYNPAKVGDSKASTTIMASSVNTNEPKRDAHLKSPDFFDAEKIPNITFTSTGVKAVDETHLQINGDLTLHGVTKPVVLDAEFGGTVKDPMGNNRAAFTATTKINRKDFGMVFNKILDNGGLAVGDEVKIEIDVEGIAKK